MIKVKITGSVALLSLSVFASASFEIALLPDTSTNRIVRYDPVSRIALGSFGYLPSGSSRNFVSCVDLGRVYVTTASGTTIYNGHTGDVIGTLDATTGEKIRISPSGNSLWGNLGNFVRRYDSGTGGLYSVNSGLITIMTVIPVNDDICLAVGVDEIGKLQAVNVTTAGLQGRVELSAAGTFNTLPQHGAVLPYGGASGGKAAFLPIKPSSGQIYFTRILLNTSGLAIGQQTVVPEYIGDSHQGSTHTLQAGHTGFYLIGDDAGDSSQTQFGHFSVNGMLISRHRTNSANTNGQNWGAALVTAPEPQFTLPLVTALASLVLLPRSKRNSRKRTKLNRKLPIKY